MVFTLTIQKFFDYTTIEHTTGNIGNFINHIFLPSGNYRHGLSAGPGRSSKLKSSIIKDA